MPPKKCPRRVTTSMAKTTPEPVGAWPAPIPFGEATAAVWLDGSMASAAIAHWLTRAGARWTALLDDRPQRPERARSSARALAESLGVTTTSVNTGSPITRPAGWAVAADAAQAAGAGWLVLAVRADEA